MTPAATSLPATQKPCFCIKYASPLMLMPPIPMK